MRYGASLRMATFAGRSARKTGSSTVRHVPDFAPTSDGKIVKTRSAQEIPWEFNAVK
jgi:hypothetical protein